MYASWVRGENPRTVMSRIIRVRSSLMSHLRQEIWDRGDCEPAQKRCRERREEETTPRSSARVQHDDRDRPYRVSGLVQLEFGRRIRRSAYDGQRCEATRPVST